jgi:hypothetical protein
MSPWDMGKGWHAVVTGSLGAAFGAIIGAGHGRIVILLCMLAVGGLGAWSAWRSR